MPKSKHRRKPGERAVTRLDEFDMIEWWDVARRVHPDMSWEQFERDWAEFAANRIAGGGSCIASAIGCTGNPSAW